MKYMLFAGIALFLVLLVSSCKQRTNKSCDMLESGDDLYIKPQLHNWLRVYYMVEVSTDGYEEWSSYEHEYKPETRPKTGMVMMQSKRYSRKYFLENETAWIGKCTEEHIY